MSFGMVASWDVRIDGAPSQWIRHRRFAIEPAWDGLVCVNPATGQRDWSAALPSVGGERDGRITTTTSAGAIVLLAHEGILHAYSPIEGRELWSWIMPARFIRPMRYAWSSDDAQAAVAESPVQLTENFQSFISMNRDGPLMTIIGSRVAILGQSELIVLDLLTGAECWRRNGIAASAFAMGQDDRICVSRMSATGKSQVLLMADGEELPGVHPDAAIGRAFQISGPYLLTNEKRFGLFGSQLKVAAVDPCTGRTAWEQTFSDGTRFSRGRHEELLVARPEGAIATLNTLTGALTEVGQIPAGSLKSRPEMMLLGDRSMVYAIVGRTGGELTSYLTMPSLRVSGEVIAFQRGEKKLAWKHSIRGLNLVLTQFDSLPVLLFAGYRTEERTAGKVSMYVQAVDLLAIDRATGRDLVKWSGPMTGGSPSGLIVDPAKRRIDLTSYNERFRLEFGKGPK
jgi:outer membrane protein assembly factor BamB